MNRYGLQWPQGTDDLTIELACFLIGRTVDQGGLGKYQHCRNAIDLLWNTEESTMKFDWHPWAERMIEEACENKCLSIAGCASSGKSDTYAVYGIVCFLADPENTRVLVTSTSLKDSRLRIWGRIKEYWNAVPGLDTIGKMVDSMGMIKYINEKGEASEASGIVLIAGESKKEKESIKKMIGFKRRRVIVIADEMPELSPTILEAAISNLDSNPFFQFIGIGNPNSRFDAHGTFSKPKHGWGSVPVTAAEWETDLGKCIRFDAELSPNILAGYTIYPYLCTEEKLEAKRKNPGEDSLLYWRMFRGFWCPTGSEAGLYSEADITQFGADDRNLMWGTSATRIAFIDPAWTTGGDRAMVYLGWVGETIAGSKVLLYDPEGVHLVDSVSDPRPVSYQIAEQFRDLCKKEDVSIHAAGVDTTGGGSTFADVLSVVWGSGFHRCLFSGSASDKPVSASDNRTCKEAFQNRVSELWGIGVQYIRSGQIKGIGKGLASEMTARLYTTLGKGVIEVESKRKMKARTGKSPDEADAAFGLLDLARERFGFECVEGEVIARQEATAGSSMTWEQYCQQGERVYQSEDYATGFIPLSF